MSMVIVAIAIIIWLFVIQNKLFELSNGLNGIRRQLENKEDEQNTSYQAITAKSEVKQTEPKSISEVSDDIFFQSKEFLPEGNSALADCKTILPEINPDEETEQAPLKAKEERKNSFESLFLGNLFNKIGALALLIGLIIFIKIISPFLVFTAGMKVALGFIAGIAMLAVGMKLHAKENLKNYSEVLLGVGFGTMFITTYCANVYLHIFSNSQAFTVATGLLLATFFLADKLKTVSMLVISLIAGYLNPFFVTGSVDTSGAFLFGYLLFVNLLSIIYTFRNNSKNVVNTVNLIMTLIVGAIFVDFKAISLIYPVILWAMYFVYDLICTMNPEHKPSKTLNYTNFVVFSIFTYCICQEDYLSKGLCELAIGLFYATAAGMRKGCKETFTQYLNLFLAATSLAVLFGFGNQPKLKVYIWALETAILAFFAEKYERKDIAGWTVGVWVASFLAATGIDNVFIAKNIHSFQPFWNTRLLIFAPLILSSFATYFIFRKSGEKRLANLAKYFELNYISMIYLYLGFEANDVINKYYIGKNTSAYFVRDMIYAIMGFIYTIQFKKLHKSTNHILFAVASTIVGVIATLHLLVNGYTYRPIAAFIPLVNLRTAAFLSAIVASILYAKWTKSEVFKYIAIAFGFVLMHVELADTIHRYELWTDDYLISIGWILYSGLITAFGIFQKKKALKISGITLCLLSVARIFIYDLANIDIMYKFAAFLVLGTILMLLSYYYNKLEK